eukprot:1156674-Pelagomonas_calceolata.AAC.11
MAISGREGLRSEGPQEGVQINPLTTPNHPQGHGHLSMPIEKGPEWDNVTLVQHEGTDGLKQGKNKCLHNVSMCFMEVAGASGYTSCKFLAVGWPSVQQLRTLGWLLMRMRGGEEEVSSSRRVGLQAKRRT